MTGPLSQSLRCWRWRSCGKTVGGRAGPDDDFDFRVWWVLVLPLARLVVE